jgi:hypothetical protein
MLQGETMNRTQNFVRSAGIKAGRVFTTGARTAATTRIAGGNIPVEVGNKGFGFWLNMLHGEKVEAPSTNWAEEETKHVQKQTHKIGTTDPYKKASTIVLGRPNLGGSTVDSYTYAGTIMNQMELQLAASGLLVANMAFDAKDEIYEGTGFQKIGTVVYPTAVENFNFTQCTLEVNSVEQKYAKEAKVTFTKPTDGGRFALGSATRLQPLTNAFNGIKIDLTVDYSDQTLYKMFAKAETTKVVFKFIGAVIPEGGTKKFELTLTFPMCRVEGDTPNIANLGALVQTIPLMVEDNGTEAPCTAVYQSTDTAC